MTMVNYLVHVMHKYLITIVTNINDYRFGQ